MDHSDDSITAIQSELTRVDFGSLPPEMLGEQWPHYLLWRPVLSTEGQKIHKRPVRGKSWQRPSQHKKFKDIRVEHTNYPSNGSVDNPPVGLGFVYNGLHPFVCIDVDKMTPANITLVETLASYTEISPSGNGRHVIMRVSDKDKLQEVFGRAAHNKTDARDLYISTGYVTLTGRNINGLGVRKIETPALQAILAQYYRVHTTPEAPTPEAPTPEAPTPEAPTPEAPELATFNPPVCIPAAQIKKYLEALPVQNLTENIFEKLHAGESVTLDPDCVDEARTPWLIIGQALHNNFSGETSSLLDGFILWQQWSSKGNKYNAQDIQDCWRSFKVVDSPVTIKALIKLFNAQMPMFPDRTPKGVLQGTFGNFRVYFDFYAYLARFNEISQVTSFVIPEERLTSWGLSDTGRTSVEQKAELILSDLITIGFPTVAFRRPQVVNFMQTIAFEHPFNPIRDYFTECGASWDGQDRITALFETLSLTAKENDPDYQTDTIYMFLRRWLLQVVAASCRDDVKFTNTIQQFNRVLIFIGSQGIGKTRWAQSLFPKRLHEYCLGSKEMKITGFRSDHVKTVMELTNTVICNLNEIDRLFEAKNYADFKGFLDTDEDIVVLPYGREPVNRIRRTVFIGSTNVPYFLTDPTGNRRIELIHCDALNAEHDINIDQLWGQIHSMYTAGERWWFDYNEEDDTKFIRERDRLNMAAMKIGNPSFVDHLLEIYDPSQPEVLWQRMTFIDIRVQVGQYMTQDRNGLPRRQFRGQKADLENWLKRYISPISETTGKLGARVWYRMPPIREDLTGADFFQPTDFDLAQKAKTKARGDKFRSKGSQ